MKRKFFGGRNDSRLADDFVFPFQERDYARPKRWKVIGEYYFDQAVDFSRIMRRRVLSFSTRFSRSSTWLRSFLRDENSDVISYKVTTLFSVYGYRLLRRYRELLRPRIETAIENKRRSIWIISLVVFFNSWLPLLNGTIGRNRGWIARKQRIPSPRRKKKENLAKNYLARYRVFGAGVYIFTLVVKGRL